MMFKAVLLKSGSVASASPGSLLKRHVLGPQPRPAHSESLGGHPAIRGVEPALWEIVMHTQVWGLLPQRSLDSFFLLYLCTCHSHGLGSPASPCTVIWSSPERRCLCPSSGSPRKSESAQHIRSRGSDNPLSGSPSPLPPVAICGHEPDLSHPLSLAEAVVG